MKHFKLFFACALMSLLSLGQVWATEQTVSWSASTGALGSAIASEGGTATGTISTGSFEWSYTRTLATLKSGKSDYVAMSGSYMQLGSSNAGEDIEFRTSNIPGTIKSVTVLAGSKDSRHTGTITVGGDDYNAGDIAAWESSAGGNWEGTGTSSGEIVISISCNVKKSPIYIASITVVYEEGGGSSVTAPTFTPNGGTFVGSQSVTLAQADSKDIYYTTDGTAGAGEPSTSSPWVAYSSAINLTATTTIYAAAKDGSDWSSIVSKTFTKIEPLTTMDAIFAAATTAGSTATDVYITFNDWIVSGAKGNTAYVTDGTKGFIVYYSGHGFNEGDILSGTGSFKLKLYNGAAEITAKNSGTITATPGGSATLNVLDAAGIDALSGVNTGSLIKISGEATSTSIVAGVTLYKTIYEASSLPSLEIGKTYNCTGVYVQFSSTKEMMPRVAADIEEVVAAGAPEAPTFSVAAGTYTSVQSVELECATAGATIYYTTDGSTPDNTSTAYTAAITVDADMTIKAIAIKDEKSSSVATAAYTINLPVSEEIQKTWDLSIVSCDADPTDELMQWSATYVTMTNVKGSGTKVTNYYPGTSGKTYTSTRFYNGNTLTITPSGKQLTTIVFTATSNDYATALANSTWTNATAVADAKVVTVTATNGELAVSAAITGTCGFTAVQVNYTAIDASKPATPTFTPIAGTYTSVQSVEIECATAGATIYYTTDGTTPTSGSTEYTAAISVDADMTIKAIAIKDEKSSNVAEAAYVINLPATEETQKTWDLTIDETATASADELTWTATYVDMSITRGTAAANNYYPGTSGKSYTETRIYNGATMTITPNGKQITSIVIEAGNGTPFKNATWTNGVAAAEGNTVTVTVSAPGAVVAEFGANAVAYSVTVNYGPIDASLPVVPTFTPAAGTYSAAQSVTLACETVGATIYYTTDGSTPTSGSTPYTAAIAVDASMTIKAVAIKDEKVGPVASAAYVINLPLTTMQAVFDEATNIGGTADDVTIQFNNWVVSGISTDGKNVYVTDGTKGFVIYDNTGTSHGFEVNDKLNGTVDCQLKLYNKFAEVLDVTSSSVGLTVTKDGVVTPVATAIADLGAVNTGAPIIVNNVKFDGTNLTDGTNTIKPYNTLFAYEALTENKYYNVTGIYVHFNTTKEIAPRNAADIEELAATAPTMAWYVDNLKSAEITTSHIITIGDAFAPYFETNSDGELTYSSSEPTIAEINATTGELTLKGVVGSATITCNVAADAVNNLLADSKSFTLQVKAAATVDNVVIVAQYNDGVEDKWLALKHDKTALEVNYSAGTIYDLSVADQAEITWKRSVSGDDVTFQDPSNDNYLKGSTGSTMSVTAGETGHYIWHWETDGFYTTLTSGTLRTPLYQGNAGEFKYYAVSNAGSSSSGGYSELPVVTAAVFATSSSKEVIRDGLSNGKWGTLCPKQTVKNVEGATFYQITSLEEKAGMPFNMIFDEIGTTTLTAGQPYFFIANATEIRGNKTGDAVTSGAAVNGFCGYIGTSVLALPNIHDEYEAGSDNTFVIYNNEVLRIKEATNLKSERCYININATVPSRSGVAPMPGRDRIRMSIAGVQTPTAVENLNASETPVKLMINGQLFILRGEKMYDATGRLVK